MPNSFTNVPQSSIVVVPATRKYIAQNGVISSLTPKEKIARQFRRKSASDYGFSTDPIGGASTVMSGATQFFSPQLSTDFLELPQSLRERREIYRHFYKADPLVGQAIDLHTELPLSKVRLAQPKPATCPEGFKSADDYGKYILSFFQKMVKRIHLFQRLILGVHHYWLDGTCLSAKTLVSTQEGEKRADKVKVGDFVLAHNGQWSPVQVTSSRRAPKLLGIDIARLPHRLDLTPEHPIEVLRDGTCQFVEAGDLKKGDFVRVTWPLKVQDVTEVNVLENSSTYNIDREYTFTAPTQLAIDEDFLYVLGYWLGAGTIARDFTRETAWGRGGWSIAFGKPSLGHLERIRNILSRKFGAECLTECKDIRDGDEIISLHLKGHPAFIEWWAAMFGETSHGYNPKHIPSWIMHLPKEKNLAVLAGLIDSDGCASVSSEDKGTVYLGMTSAKIIGAARDLMLRVGVIPSYRIIPASKTVSYLRGGLVKSNYPVHALIVNDADQCRLVVSKADNCTHFDVPVEFADTHNSFILDSEGNIGFLVRDIAKLPSEVVYNIQVEDAHTFRAGYVSTHNCTFFAEDGTVEIPQTIGYTKVQHKESFITDAGDAVEKTHVEWEEKDNKDDAELAYYQKHYKGWDKLIVLPIDQVSIKSFSFTDKVKVELIPSTKVRQELLYFPI